MAPSLTARASPLPFPRLSCAKNHRLLSVRCRSGSSGSDGDDKGTPPVIRAAVSAITELLRALSPVGKPTQAAEAVDTELELPRSVDDVVAVLEADYGRAYFLTGNFTLGIYAEDCLFEDPTIKFRGTQQVTLEYYVGTYFYCISSMKPCQATSNRRTLMCQEQNSMMLIPPLYSLGRSRYSQNLDLLVPFFDSPSLKLEDIEKGLRADTKFVIATWTLRTYLRLPWRPLIAIRGNTTYDLDEEYKVVRHAERWDVSALEAIGQLFVSAPKETGS